PRVIMHCYIVYFFFFQAEDGIRDFHVTGVQTCALPIFEKHSLLLKKKSTEINKDSANTIFIYYNYLSNLQLKNFLVVLHVLKRFSQYYLFAANQLQLLTIASQ